MKQINDWQPVYEYVSISSCTKNSCSLFLLQLFKEDKIYAIVFSGGKQYKVEENSDVVVERIEGNEGDKVTLSDVFMVNDGDKIRIGNPKIKDAEVANLPIYVLRSNTPHQIKQFLSDIFPAEKPARAHSLKTALSEAEEAVGQVKEGEEGVELSPQSAYIRRLQHLIAQRNDLLSQSTGKEPNRRVRIYR